MAATRGSPRRSVVGAHAALQAAVVAATAAGLPLGMLLPVAGPTPHKCTGYAALACAAIPLTAALWRPPPGPSRARRAWALSHRATGLLALALAWVSGALGAVRTRMAVAAEPAVMMGAGGAVLAAGYAVGWWNARKRAAVAASGKGGGDGSDAASSVPSTRALV